MNVFKLNLIFCLLLLFRTTGMAQEQNSDFVALGDTSRIVSSISQNDVRIIKNEEALLLKKGEILNIQVDNPNLVPTQVRIHSSLGRCVKRFPMVTNEVSMSTDILLPGVYLIIIRQGNVREIRRFLITDE